MITYIYHNRETNTLEFSTKLKDILLDRSVEEERELADGTYDILEVETKNNKIVRVEVLV